MLHYKNIEPVYNDIQVIQKPSELKSDSHISEEVLVSLYERYIFADNKDEFLSSLVQNSDIHFFMKLMNALNTSGLEIPDSLKTEITNYTTNFNNANSKKIMLKYLLLQIGGEKDETKRKELLMQLNNKFLSWSFNYPKPKQIDNLEKFETMDPDFQKLPSKIPTHLETMFSIDAIQNMLYEGKVPNFSARDPNNITKNFEGEKDLSAINPEIFCRLNLSKIPEQHFRKILTFLLINLKYYDLEDFVSHLHKFIQEAPMNERSQINGRLSQIYNKMTLKQLEEFEALLSQNKTDDIFGFGADISNEFLQAKFEKSFNLRNIAELQIDNPLEYYNKILELFKWSIATKDAIPAFHSYLLKGLLVAGLDIKIYDMDLFRQYIELPLRQIRSLNSEYTKTLQVKNKNLWQNHTINFWCQCLRQLNLNEKFDDLEMIDLYLTHDFKTKKDFEEYRKFFKYEFLSEAFHTTKLMQGENLESVHELFSAKQLEEINERKMLKFARFNKKQFLSDEEVSFTLEIKNISSLTINIFEINSQNYYRKHHKDITLDIDLEGLIPAKSNTINYNDNSIICSLKDIKLDYLSSRKRGVFIVEFIGGGISSRALVKKGSLTAVSQIIKGFSIYHVIDEEKKICKSDTSIMFNDQIYKSDQDSGKIMIPLEERPIIGKAILINNDFSELIDLEIPEETYELKVDINYNEECLLPGTLCEFVVAPKQYCNGKVIPLSYLKDAKVTIISVNENTVRSQEVFHDLSLAYDKDIVIKYMIPTKIIHFEIVFQADMEQEAKTKLKQTKTTNIVLNKQLNTDKYIDAYLRNTENGYVVKLLGKNGEPIPKTQAKVNLDLNFLREIPQLYNSGYNRVKTNHQDQDQNRLPEFVLESNENGELELGFLKNIKKMKLDFHGTHSQQVKRDTTYKEWSLENTSSFESLSNNFDIVFGEGQKQPQLPIALASFDSNNYKLYQMTDYEKVIKNCFEYLKSSEGQIIINNDLPVGEYNFHYNCQSVQKFISIKVHSGKRWEYSPNYLINSNEIIKLSTQSNYLVCQKLDVTDNEIKMKILSNQPLDQVKVHMLAFNYLPNNNYGKFEAIQVPDIWPNQTFKLTRNSNSYMNSKILSDEIQYVLNRKTKRTFMGNTLEKPQVLLERQFSKKTEQVAENLNRGMDYQEKIFNPNNRVQQLVRSNTILRDDLIKNTSIDQLNAYQVNNGQIEANLKLDENGEVTIPVKDLKELKLSTVILQVSNNRSNFSKTVDLKLNKNEEPVKRDLSLQTSRDSSKVYQVSRFVHNIAKDKTLSIKDFENTEISMISSLGGLYDSLMLLGNFKGKNNDDWSFQKNWGKLEPLEKQKKYDEFVSHELNLFVYFKDNEFFELVVKPHLVNKYEKDFIDYFLIDDKEKLKTYLRSDFISDNVHEQVLQVTAQKDVCKDECLKFIDMMKMKDSRNKYDLRQFKLNYDTVFNSQKVKDEDLNIEKIDAGHVTVVNSGTTGNLNYNNNRVIRPQMQMRSMVQNVAPRGSNFHAAMPMQMNMMTQQVIQPMQQEMMTQQVIEELDQMEMNTCFNNEVGYGDEFMCQQSLNYEYNNDDMYRSDQSITMKKSPKKIQNFEQFAATNEYVEKKYYENRVQTIQTKKFYLDYIDYVFNNTDKSIPFLSENFIYCFKTFTEIAFVLSLMDLSFEKVTHESKTNERDLEITAKGPLLVFCKEIIEQPSVLVDHDQIVSQKFFDPQDRWRVIDTKRVLKKVDEFVKGKMYGSRVAITNSNDIEYEINILTEIPQGSIPVNKLDYFKSTTINLRPLTTEIIEFNFYFPKTGEFTIYSASITKDAQLVGTAACPKTLTVLDKKKSAANVESIIDVLDTGNKNDILEFLKTQNLCDQLFKMSDIYFQLKDKQFYEQVVQILNDRYFYDEVVHQFSIFHGDIATFQKYCRANPNKINKLQFVYLSNTLMDQNEYNVKEYSPLINSRVHDLSSKGNNIRDKDFKKTYTKFLTYLVEKGHCSAEDNLIFSMYLLLQDRIDESLKVFSKINSEELSNCLIIQYDYLQAYLNLYIDYPKFDIARQVCSKYLVYPILNWRNKFIDLANQLAEFDGECKIEKVTLNQKTGEKNQIEADQQEYFAVELVEVEQLSEQDKNTSSSNNKVQKVTHKNIDHVVLSYYEIDLEIMFSRNPFIKDDVKDFSFVKANMENRIELQKANDYETQIVKIPENLINNNLFIQVTSGAHTKSLTYFPTNMKVFLVEAYGKIKVTDTNGKPLNKVYVKCFQKNNNDNVDFYKDGYTDLTGTFDYAGLNLDNLGAIQMFSLLISGGEGNQGAIIKEVKPPKTKAKKEVEVKKVIGKTWVDSQNLKLRATTNKYCL